MVDNRKSTRELTLLTGRLLSPFAANSIDCAVLDISQSGACILLPKGTEAPDAFVLEIDRDPRARNCRIVWRNGCRMGVVFAPG